MQCANKKTKKKCNDGGNKCIMRADGSRENDGDKNLTSNNTQTHTSALAIYFY